MGKLHLDGIWQLSWCDLNTGSVHMKGADKKTIPCAVPGAVHSALIDAEIIKEPLEGLNSKECDWIITKEWWYEKSFTLSGNDIKDRTEITFEGLDLTADIYLNSTFAARANNAFISHI